jgi:NAD(P)H dehydrogenase (quinone)
MDRLPTLAVTGSTGALGGMVARTLAEAGVAQRLVVRDLDRAPALPGAVPVVASYADREAAVRALEGVSLLFMVSASESADRREQHLAFVDAAVAAGVEHVVYTSFFGAAPDATFTLARDHFATEEGLRASGASYTFLRDNLYADVVPYLVGDDGVIRGPAGEGRTALVARADVARVAVAVLRDPAAHRDVTYDLTGPEALTFTEIAEVLTRHLGRPVTFHDETVEEAYESRRRWPAPDWQYDAWVSTYLAVRAGELEPVSGDVERVTGTPPVDLETLLTR